MTVQHLADCAVRLEDGQGCPVRGDEPEACSSIRRYSDGNDSSSITIRFAFSPTLAPASSWATSGCPLAKERPVSASVRGMLVGSDT